MSILNIGSLNWDHAFKVSHLPAKGETVAAKSATLSLGGKGLNYSIAVLRAGCGLRHCGAIGANDAPMLEAFARVNDI